MYINSITILYNIKRVEFFNLKPILSFSFNIIIQQNDNKGHSKLILAPVWLGLNVSDTNMHGTYVVYLHSSPVCIGLWIHFDLYFSVRLKARSITFFSKTHMFVEGKVMKDKNEFVSLLLAFHLLTGKDIRESFL